MFEPLRCPDCDWTSKPKHKRPKSALGLHRKAKHSIKTLVAEMAAAKEEFESWPGTPEHLVRPQPDNGGLQAPLRSGSSTVMLDPNPLPSKAIDRPGFLVTFASGEQRHVPAEEYQETVDRHWFFWGGALKESYKRRDVTAVEVA